MPHLQHQRHPAPISGWMEAKGVVIETTPNGDQVLMGAAANQESEASDPRGPANAATSARLLYRRLVEMFPNSPLVPEAAWRAADDLWQMQKADASSRSSAKERDPYMRDQMDEEEMKKILKLYPHTRQADLAAFELIDNSSAATGKARPNAPRRKPSISRNTPPNTLTALAQPRPYTRPSIASPYSTTCSPPMAAKKGRRSQNPCKRFCLPSARQVSSIGFHMARRGPGV